MSGRIRTIKPEINEDDKTASLDDHTWRLFVAMLVLADDYGNMRGAAEWLHGQVFWRFPDAIEKTRESLATLSRVSLVTLYSNAGQDYLAITNWSRHQRVDKPGKPRVPGPKDPENVGQNEYSRESPESVARVQEIPAPRARAQDPDPDPDQRPPTREEEGECRGGAAPPEPPAGSAPAPPRPPERPRRRKAAQEQNGGDPNQPRRGGKKDFPQDWAPNDHAKELAAKLRLDLEGQAESFRAYYGARGRRMVDWDLAFYGWLRKSGDMRAERAERQGNSRLHPQPQPLNDKPLDVKRGKF